MAPNLATMMETIHHQQSVTLVFHFYPQVVDIHVHNVLVFFPKVIISKLFDKNKKKIIKIKTP